ncbi:hypothetical protein, partial [Pseudomonas lundensis]|uniref:hypothetical protein n=1 Tax=Pseudomonas lundensis TaxID=86185 RepID=UPI001473274C
LGSGRAMTLTTGSLLNQNGLLFSGGDMSLRVERLKNLGADIYAMGNLSIDRDGKGAFATSIINSSSSIQSDGNLSLAAGTFQNQGGSVLHVGTGVFDIAGINLDNVGGSLVTQGDLSLDKNHWTNSSLIQAGNLTVNVDNLEQTSSGQLLAANRIKGTGQNWSTQGVIASNGSLELNLG